MTPAPLRLGFVSVIRPAFKGDSARAANLSLDHLTALGQEHGFVVVTPEVATTHHAATGAQLPNFAVHDAQTAAHAARQLRAAKVDFLLLQHTTFATGDVMEPLFRAAERVGVWAVPEVPEGQPYAGPLPLNSLCGLNMTLSFLDSPRVATGAPVKWFYGAAQSEWFQSRLLVTLAALRGLKALAEARVLQIGGTAPGFYGLEEPLGLAGAQVDTLPLAAFLERVGAIDERRAAATAHAQAQGEPHDVTADQLVRSARIELALADLAAEGGHQALAVRCWPELPESCGSMACAAMGNLSSGVPAACEGDVPGALSMLALQAVSGHSAVLLDLSSLDEVQDQVMFWHCGNAPLEWAAGGNSRLTTHFNRDGVGTVRDMVLAPGPATGFRLVGTDAAFVMAGTFAGPQRSSFDGVSGWMTDLTWNGAPLSGKEFVTNVLDQRLAHHFAFGRGQLTEALQELCAWLGRRPLGASPVTMALKGPTA